jgi:hypothetical protein
MQANRLVVIALYLLVGGGMTLLTSALRFDRDARSCLAAMWDGTAHRPFVMRRLVPDTLATLTRWTPTAWQRGVVKAIETMPPPLPQLLLGRNPQVAYAHLLLVISVWVCYFGVLWCWQWLLRAYLELSDRLSLWLPVVGLGLVYPLLNWRHGVHVYDPATLLLYSLALGALLQQKWGLYALIFALAAWHKETALLLIFAPLLQVPPASRGEPRSEPGSPRLQGEPRSESGSPCLQGEPRSEPGSPCLQGEPRSESGSPCLQGEPKGGGSQKRSGDKPAGGGDLKARVVGVLVMGLFYLGVRLGLGWHYRQNEGDLLEFWLLKENLPLLMSVFTEFGWREARFLLILTVAIGLPAWGWRAKPLLLRRMLLVGVVLFSPLWLLFGILDEFRALLELYPLWLMLCVPAGYSLPFSTATAPSGTVSRS